MPTIGIKKYVLDQYMGEILSEEQWEERCFKYGLELDEVTSEKAAAVKEKGEGAGEALSEEEVYKIELPANRSDLLCVEGLTRALKIFGQEMKPIKYRLAEPEQRQKLLVVDDTNGGRYSIENRRFVVAAILRDVTITQAAYDSFIDLQDKLHQNIGRKRALVSMGTHDLDTVTGPFTYRFEHQSKIKFRALNQEKEMTASDLLEVFKKDTHMKQFVPIIGSDPDAPYPLITDANGTVMSMPPMINSDKTKITLNTENIFVEMTCTDVTKGSIALDTLVCLFSQYCKKPFTVEPVDVVRPNGDVHVYPELEHRTQRVEVDAVRRKIGIDITAEEMASLLTRMSLESEVVEGGKGLKVAILPTRRDVLHECDIGGAVAIAFGYDSVVHKGPQTYTVGEPLPLNKFSEQLRQEMGMAGYTEMVNYVLCPAVDISTKLRLGAEEPDNAVLISNPKSREFQVARTTLLPGLLKSLSSNRHKALPLRLFEVQDVVLKDRSRDVGARNERWLSAVYMDKRSGFEIIHDLLNRVMKKIDISLEEGNDVGNAYFVRPGHHCPTFFNGQWCTINTTWKGCVGWMGVLHPEVLSAFGLKVPVTAIELNLGLVM